LATLSKVLISLALLAGFLAADTVILECLVITHREGAALLSFRAAPRSAQKFDSATLALHLIGTKYPPIRVNGRPTPIRSQANGWITLPVPLKEAAKPVKIEPQGFFDDTTAIGLAPYLVLDSAAARPPQ